MFLRVTGRESDFPCESFACCKGHLGPVHGQNRDDLAVFFVLCFLALGGRCLQMLCLPGFGTHANTQNLPHFRACPASIQEQCPPKCLFFMANAKLPNRPGFALLPVGPSGPKVAAKVRT